MTDDGEKRLEPRHPVSMPVEVRRQGQRDLAVSRNVSPGGMFIACLQPLRCGEVVRLLFALPGQREVHSVVGEVVRVPPETKVSNGPGSIWRHRAALRLKDMPAAVVHELSQRGA
jgi:hypothetical protein